MKINKTGGSVPAIQIWSKFLLTEMVRDYTGTWHASIRNLENSVLFDKACGKDPQRAAMVLQKALDAIANDATLVASKITSTAKTLPQPKKQVTA